MKVKLDENLPGSLAKLLRSAGHDVATVADENLSGKPDAFVLRTASAELRTFFTFDTDFADVHRYPLGSHAGIVVFRLQDQRWATLRTATQRLVASGMLAELGGGLAVVGPARVRIRTN
jgi:predicted nuclease of predicted toxin-antitoxin system